MDDLLKQLATGGPLAGWVLASVLLLGVIYQHRELRSLNKERYQDLKDSREFSDDLKAVVLPLVSSTDSIFRMLTEVKTQLEILKDRSKL